MSGRKYSIATLNRAKQLVLRRNNCLDEIGSFIDSCHGDIATFCSIEHQELPGTIQTVDSIKIKYKSMSKIKLMVNDNIWNEQLNALATDLSREIETAQSDISKLADIKSRIDSLRTVLTQGRKIERELDVLRQDILRMNGDIGDDITRFSDSHFIAEKLDAFRDGIAGLAEKCSGTRLNFDEDPDQARCNLNALQRDFHQLKDESSRFIVTAKENLKNAAHIEAADVEFKKDLRKTLVEKNNKAAEKQSIQQKETLTMQQLWQERLARIASAPGMAAHPEARELIQGIEDFSKLQKEHPSYSENEIKKRFKLLERLASRVEKLISESARKKSEMLAGMFILKQDNRQFSLTLKAAITELEKQVTALLPDDILDPVAVLAIEKKLEELRFLANKEKEKNEQQEYLIDALKTNLESMGYNVISAQYSETDAVESPQCLDFAITDRIKLQVSVTWNLHVLYQVVYLSNDESISDEELENISNEVKHWEKDYSSLCQSLTAFGISLSKEWIEQISKDGIIIEKSGLFQKHSQFHQLRETQKKNHTEVTP